MKLSKKSTLAIESLIEISASDKLLSIKEISKKRGCSIKYLEHIFSSLKKAGLVESMLGKNGGYKLNKDPNEINCRDIVLAVEKKIEPVTCLSSYCDRENFCLSKSVWIGLQKTLYTSLAEVSLSSLANSYKEQIYETNYQI